MWSFDTNKKKWEQISDYPITKGADGVFVINGKAYIIEDGTINLWEFDPNK